MVCGWRGQLAGRVERSGGAGVEGWCEHGRRLSCKDRHSSGC